MWSVIVYYFTNKLILNVLGIDFCHHVILLQSDEKQKFSENNKFFGLLAPWRTFKFRRPCTVQMSPYSNSNYLGSTVSIITHDMYCLTTVVFNWQVPTVHQLLSKRLLNYCSVIMKLLRITVLYGDVLLLVVKWLDYTPGE